MHRKWTWAFVSFTKTLNLSIHQVTWKKPTKMERFHIYKAHSTFYITVHPPSSLELQGAFITRITGPPRHHMHPQPLAKLEMLQHQIWQKILHLLIWWSLISQGKNFQVACRCTIVKANSHIASTETPSLSIRYHTPEFWTKIQHHLLQLGGSTYYLAEYQFWAHLASTDRSTWRIFLPLKGLDMHSTTMAFATSADSVGPSKITSSWTCFRWCDSQKFSTKYVLRSHGI